MSSDTLLTLDLLDLAHANISEAGTTGGPVTTFVSMFEAFWNGYASPLRLKKAQEQVARVQIDLYGHALDIEFKGWAAVSRWATEENGLDPWLAAIDPKQGSEPADPERFRSSATERQREILERMLATFGFSDGIPMVPSKDARVTRSGDFQARRDLWRQLVLSDDREIRGLSAAYIRGTFLPIQNYEEIAALERDCFRLKHIRRC